MKIPGIKVGELATELGIGKQTIYNWKQLPKYVEMYLKQKSEIVRLRDEVRVLRNMLKEK